MQRQHHSNSTAFFLHNMSSTSSSIAIASIVITASGGMVWLASANNASQRAASSPKSTHSSQQTPPGPYGSDTGDTESVLEPFQPKGGNQNTTGSSSSLESTSTVTVNGQTKTLTGDGTIRESYTSPDGKSDVSISIDHSSSNTADTHRQSTEIRQRSSQGGSMSP